MLRKNNKNENIMTSLHSPKAHFSASVYFDKPARGLGSVVSLTADSIEQIKSDIACCGYKRATVVIWENRKKYPEFEWVKVESYTI